MRRAPIALAIAALLMLPSAATARERFDVRVLAHIPDPGFSALSLVAPDRTIYAGTFHAATGGSGEASRVFAFAPDGRLLRSYEIEGQTPSDERGVQVAAIDARGRLYVLDEKPPRVIVLDPRNGEQRTYATFRDVPTCPAGQSAGDCSAATVDDGPEPAYAAWGPDGSLYVTDYTQGLIWRVPPGGGDGQVWFTDPRIDGVQFGPVGIELMADHRTLMFDTSAGGFTTGNLTTGELYTLPIQPDGRPGPLHRVWESLAADGPDGFAIARSGNVYMALVADGRNQIVEISPAGEELARFPDPLTNALAPVPFDMPSSVEFDGERLIVTNLSQTLGDRSHQVLFDIFAGEPGLTPFVPDATSLERQPRYRLSVTPRRVRAGRRTRLRFRATENSADVRKTVADATIRLGRLRVRTGSDGRADMVVRLRRGRVRAVLYVGAERSIAARATIEVR